MRWLDRIVLEFDRGICCLISNDYQKTQWSRFNETARVRSIDYYIVADRQDSKTDTNNTAALQHVSIMIAVAGVLTSLGDPSIFRYVFGFELLAYVLISLLCLRLLIDTPFLKRGDFPGDVEYVRAETVFRDLMLSLAAKLTLFVSAILIVSVVLKLVFL